ncbi:MAG: hypothetical protein A3D64_01300 [Candidatus Wildermuthbacteria bacterium RIFCSPHIGHO2_02_FULL_49_9]|uniref:SGNH hydrolase-type esterase domain-containing protein n=2 Tax=Candidatus Wildermuthiibacteriota TaxID=1817923 RepID=A0A1G2R0X3_9BACT|nr:MAG: hypothetical protein A2672_00300 [Candidatus Wildermuthbacteria bacterium RIFCSPHIGHO2_01_FULL_49_22b]OHA70639.1 MAG: hypothetical protein A3D64_01300 [Candidatus Wildermuthbacteria bacterium RIFCSPHIGHO2_02_FULL_49_9]
MRLFIAKSCSLGLIVAVLALLWANIPLWIHDFDQSSWEAATPFIPNDAHVDVVMLGTSHGRIFSRAQNHSRVESLLGKSVLNLSRSGGRGVWASELYLRYFFERNNETDTIVYFIDPWVLYSDAWNVANDLFYDEPLDLSFSAFLLERKAPIGMFATYLKSKLTLNWLLEKPNAQSIESQSLCRVDEKAVRKRIESLYPNGTEQSVFGKYKAILEGIAQYARSRDTRLIFILPTTLLGDLPGETQLKQTLQELQTAYGTEWYDLSESIADACLYQDHDHLNTEGIVLFTNKYLKPILNKESASDGTQ